AGRRQRRLLTGGDDGLGEIVDQLVKHPVPVELGFEVHEHRAEAYCSAVHEDELARWPDPAEPADVAMDTLGDGGAIGSAAPFLDQPLTILEQRPIDEQGPPVQHVDYLAGQIAEAPTLIGVDSEVAIVALQGVVEIDDTAHEGSGKDPNTAEIEKVDGPVGRHRVVAEMRVAVNDPVVIERHVPHPEHAQGNLVAFRKWGVLCDVED